MVGWFLWYYMRTDRQMDLGNDKYYKYGYKSLNLKMYPLIIILNFECFHFQNQNTEYVSEFLLLFIYVKCSLYFWIPCIYIIVYNTWYCSDCSTKIAHTCNILFNFLNCACFSRYNIALKINICTVKNAKLSFKSIYFIL